MRSSFTPIAFASARLRFALLDAPALQVRGGTYLHRRQIGKVRRGVGDRLRDQATAR
jgi:hypothetical protein